MDYFLTHSCYDPDSKGLACGACDSCLLRVRGFKEAGVDDPIMYKYEMIRKSRMDSKNLFARKKGT